MQYGDLKVILTKWKTKIRTGLLASIMALLAPLSVLATAATDNSEPRQIVSHDKLPAMSAGVETAWLSSLNNETSDAEPPVLESCGKSESESGAEAAIMPAPIASRSPSRQASAETPKLELAAAGDQFTSARLVSDPNEAPNAVEELTRQILLKEIALEKFNLNYKLNAARQGRFKGWRYAAAGEVNGGLGLAGACISMYNRGVHIHRSSQVKTYIQEDANYIPMIGNIIGAGAAVIELGINEFHDYQAYTKGFSPGKARQHVTGLKNDIDRLMAEREQLLKLEQSAPLLTGRVEVDALEGKVLTDLRDQSLLEYQRFHLSARRLLAFQQSQYMFDFARNVTGAIGYDFAYLSLHRHRRVWNGRAGTLFDVAGGLQILGPILARGFAAGASKYHKHYVHKTIKEAEACQTAVLERDQKELDACLKSGKYTSDTAVKAVDRSAIYSAHSKIFQDEILSASKQLNKAKLVATENVASGIFIGGGKLAQGILFNACGYPQLYNKKTGQTASRVTNHLLFAASVATVPGTTFGMLDTLRIQVQGELNRHKLAAGGNLPAQLIQKRLAQLDSVEAKLSTAHP